MKLPKFVRRQLKNREMINFYAKFINEHDLCFELGANIGERTDIFLDLGARVVAIEPQNTCFEILRKKFSKHDRVHLEQVAIGSNEREGTLLLCDEVNECATLSEEFVKMYAEISNFNWSNRQKVKITTIENICRQYGVPKFCKIDVEGYESQVFAGLQSPIKYICFEFNKPLLHDTLNSLNLLNSMARYQCNFIRYEHMSLALKSWVSIDNFCDNLYQYIGDDVLTGEIIVECLDL